MFVCALVAYDAVDPDFGAVRGGFDDVDQAIPLVVPQRRERVPKRAAAVRVARALPRLGTAVAADVEQREVVAA